MEEAQTRLEEMTHQRRQGQKRRRRFHGLLWNPNLPDWSHRFPQQKKEPHNYLNNYQINLHDPNFD